jgi:D-arabinose 1-dehydrogenase-like Zn-dependent alcohol dehydrogenase
MWVCGISYAEHTQIPQFVPLDSSITTKGYFSVYPNSKSATFQIILNDKELVGSASLKVKDVEGNVILERNIQVNAGINMFGVTDYIFTPGTYYFYVEQEARKTNTLKVILQN